MSHFSALSDCNHRPRAKLFRACLGIFRVFFVYLFLALVRQLDPEPIDKAFCCKICGDISDAPIIVADGLTLAVRRSRRPETPFPVLGSDDARTLSGRYSLYYRPSALYRVHSIWIFCGFPSSHSHRVYIADATLRKAVQSFCEKPRSSYSQVSVHILYIAFL